MCQHGNDIMCNTRTDPVFMMLTLVEAKVTALL